MHVALNAHLLSFGTTYRGAGISRYIRQLLAHLRQAPGGNSFIVFLGDHRIPPELDATDRFRPIVSRLPTSRPYLRMLWEQLLQPLALRAHRTDVLHSLGYVQPLWCPARSVLTIHDLSFLRYPEAFNAANLAYLRFFTKLSVQRAHRIVAVSQSTKHDLIDLLGVPDAKIVVVYHGVEEHFRPFPKESLAGRRISEMPERFILYCGTLEPRKNVDSLLEAFAILKKETGLPHKLVIAGAKGWRYEQIFATLRKNGLSGEVLFPGYLASDVQPLWYNAADLFVYPSLYEGFGFPPLEAMACGTPVVASNRSSIPEVVGDAGALVDPMDIMALAEAMQQVLEDPELRAAMARRGLQRAKEFSWQRAAQETMEVYRNA